MIGAQPLATIARSASVTDYWAMTKPEVNLLVVITTAAGFALGSQTAFPDVLPLLLHTVFGTLLVASGAAVLNQWMEHEFDARMRRTTRRPIASGRIEPIRALVFGTALSSAGTAYLFGTVNVLSSLLAAVTLLTYLFLYTPSKRLTPLCTVIGAVPGALPPLIGWAAARGRVDFEAWILFAIVFLWQFPHFMAIAWMYREDYDRAGYVVLPGEPARETVVRLQTVAPLIALLAVSLLPIVVGTPSISYAIAAVVLGAGFCYFGISLTKARSRTAARRLLMASLVYLPSLFLLLLLRGHLR